MEWERTDKPLRDLIEIIHFTENVSVKIHGVLDEAEIYRAVREEFAKSKRYTASILLLTEDGSKLGIAETSIASEELRAGEKAAGVRLKGYKIDLDKSSIFSQVVREGETVQVNVGDTIGELFPRPLAYLISKIMGYEKTPSILTPLKRRGKIIGAIGVSSTELAEHLVPSVRNLAQHISTALELADEHARRKRAEEELRKYRDHLEELVEERTAELIKANEQLQREITERTRTEEALRASEERFALAVRGSNDGIWDWDILNNSLYWSPRFKELLGYDAAELDAVFETFESHLHPDDREPTMAAIEAHLKDRVPYDVEERLHTKSGEYRWFRARGQALWDEAGNPLRFAGSITDINEHKQAEEALRGSEERYRTLFEGVPVGLYRTTAKGQILDANPALVQMLGYPDRESLLWVNAADLYVDPEDREREQTLLEREGVVHDFEAQLRRRDGTIIWVRDSARVVQDADGGVLYYEGSLVDITERRRVEEKLKKYSERLEEMVEERTKELRDAQERMIRQERLAVLGQLAGGVGHELRNPLGVISNAVYFLQLTLPDETTATAREYLEIISEEVRNSTKIVSDLLDFSRTRMPDREEVAVSELVAEVLEKQPPPEEVEVTTQIAPDLPLVFVDPQQMGQVLDNLVTNAYQAMKEGGALTIKTSEVSGKPPRSEVALTVSDTGCGISPENLPKIFEPLFTTRARGIGLGLAVSRSLVEANGGSIEVESTVEEGSTFTVRLPIKEGVS